MPEPRPDLAAIRERWVVPFTGSGFYDMESAYAWRNEQAEGDIRALVAHCEELEAALASRAPAGESTQVNEDYFTDDWYTEAMNLVARIDPLAYKGGASLIERLCYIAAAPAPDGRANSEELERLRDKVAELEGDMVLLAKLAYPEPQFDNPFEIWTAQAIRDRVLRGATP